MRIAGKSMRYDIYFELSHTSRRIPYELARADFLAVFGRLHPSVVCESPPRKRLSVELPLDPPGLRQLAENLAFTEAILSCEPAPPGSTAASVWTPSRWQAGIARRGDSFVRLTEVFVKEPAAPPSAAERLRARGLSSQSARYVLNVAGVTAGDTVLDPFCGRGSIAAEGLSRGAVMRACDIDSRLVAHLAPDVRRMFAVADAAFLPFPSRAFRHIVTEPPFRSAQRSGFLRALPELSRVTTCPGRITLLLAPDMVDACAAFFGSAGRSAAVHSRLPRTRGLDCPVLVCDSR